MGDEIRDNPRARWPGADPFLGFPGGKEIRFQITFMPMPRFLVSAHSEYGIQREGLCADKWNPQSRDRLERQSCVGKLVGNKTSHSVAHKR